MPDATITITSDKGTYTITTSPATVGGVLQLPPGAVVQFDAVGAPSITVAHTGPDPFTTTPIVATAAGASYTLQQTGSFSLNVAGTSSPTLPVAPVYAFVIGSTSEITLGAGAIVQFETGADQLPLTIATSDSKGNGVNLFVGETNHTTVLTNKVEQRTVGAVADDSYQLADGSPMATIPIIGTINVSTRKRPH
ncbi:MAG: hypothetical protein R3B06_16120 [Kofleriaceae bacterium]